MKELKHARRAGVPVVGISTPDPAETALALAQINGDEPKIRWDIAAGCRGLNQNGQAYIDQDATDCTGDPVTLFTQLAPKLPARAMVFVIGANLVTDNPVAAQALANLRDAFKADQRMVVLLDHDLQLPPTLQNDVVLFDEPLPGRDQVERIVREIAGCADVTLPDNVVEKSVDALIGLPAFAVEQITAMTVQPDGIDIEAAWTRKIKMVEQTPGLSVNRHGGSPDQIGGCSNVKGFVSRLVKGCTIVVFIDEVEKAMAGAGSDLSGTSQDQLGCLLTYMQDERQPGIMFLGPPGSAKSMTAKSTGLLTISLDLGAVKGSLVGQSEQQLRAALKVIKSISDGRALWIATSNNIDALPPELKRRFKLGTFYFDLPSQEERQQIWSLKLEHFALAGQELPDDTDWTGAEIEACCEIAQRLDCTLQEAAGFIVPVARSAAEQVETLRAKSNGRYISASYPGTYCRTTTPPARRALTLSQE
jgi:hypothetical protein